MCTIEYNDNGSLRTVCASQQYRAAQHWPDAVERNFDAPRGQLFFIDNDQWIHFLANGEDES